MKKTVIFGAGQIGRGFIGDICYHSGYSLVFVDISRELVDLLNKKKEYPLWLLSGGKTEKTIKNFMAIHLSDTRQVAQEIMGAEILFTAVGANNLKSVAPLIAAGIRMKMQKKTGFHVNTVICENLLGSSKVLIKEISNHFSEAEMDKLSESAGFVEAVVSRMVAPLTEENKKNEPLIVTVEPYNVLPVAKKQFRGGVPGIKGLYPVEDLFPYEELKIFVHNLAHATLAYSGYLKGYKYIWESLRDKKIHNLLEGVLTEVKPALIKKHKFPKQEIEDYIGDLKKRFDNPLLNDTIIRVARDPMRKLGSNDRIAGAINLCLSQDIWPGNITVVAAKCLCYNYPQDPSACQLLKIMEEKGASFILETVSGIRDNNIKEGILKHYREIKNESSSP